MGNIITKKVNEVLYENYPNGFFGKPRGYYLRPLNKEYTYILIFGPYQEALLEWFLKCKEVNILFKSKKAVNINYRNSNIKNRNTVVVFELKTKGE